MGHRLIMLVAVLTSVLLALGTLYLAVVARHFYGQLFVGGDRGLKSRLPLENALPSPSAIGGVLSWEKGRNQAAW
jgi:hypothetical protein